MHGITRKSTLWLGFAIGNLLAANVNADTVCIDIEATVAQVYDYNNKLGGRVAPGATVYGQYIYDDATVDSNPLPGVGDYWHYSSPNGLFLQVADMNFRTDPANVNFLVEILNDHTGMDAYLLRSYNNLADGVTLSDTSNLHLSWQLDGDTTALSTTALTSSPPDLSRFVSIFGLDISNYSYGYYDEQFMIRSHVSSAVPCGVPDTDGDGIDDEQDLCPASDLAPTLSVAGIDTGVENQVLANGCSLADGISNIAIGAKNKGQFTSNVARFTNDLASQGLLTASEKGKIQSVAAKAK